VDEVVPYIGRAILVFLGSLLLLSYFWQLDPWPLVIGAVLLIAGVVGGRLKTMKAGLGGFEFEQFKDRVVDTAKRKVAPITPDRAITGEVHSTQPPATTRATGTSADQFRRAYERRVRERIERAREARTPEALAESLVNAFQHSDLDSGVGSESIEVTKRGDA